jgi:hypothetical protein
MPRPVLFDMNERPTALRIVRQAVGIFARRHTASDSERPVVDDRQLLVAGDRGAFRPCLAILIAVALLGAYAIASKNGPTGAGQDQPAAGFSH